MELLMQDRTPEEIEAYVAGYVQATKDVGGPLMGPRVSAIYPDPAVAALRSMADNGAWIEALVDAERR